MCFHTQQSQDAQTLENRFQADFDIDDNYEPPYYFNAFTFPKTPVIRNNQAQIQMVKWGLLPSWAKDQAYAKHTLNARIETIDSKPSFRSYTKNRCLILVDGFFEWKWLDEKGTKKQKYLLDRQGKPFALAGLWSEWTDKNTGEIIPTYTILTTGPNELMKPIHIRMPMVLHEAEESKWLSGDKISADRAGVELYARAI